MGVSEARARIELLEHLPKQSRVATRLLDAVLEREDAATDALVSALAADPAFAAAVVRAAADKPLAENGLRPMAAALGRGGIQQLVLTEAFLGFTDPPGFDYEAFWSHSLSCAAFAEKLASTAGLDPAEAYLAGLLHDIGKLALVQANSAAQASGGAAAPAVPIAEQAALGFDHTQSGKWLAERWGFPKYLVDGIWFHHHPPGTLVGTRRQIALIELIGLANRLAHPEINLGSEYQALLSRLAVSPSALAELAETVAARVKEVRAQFPHETGSALDRVPRVVLELLRTRNAAQQGRNRLDDELRRLRALDALFRVVSPALSTKELLTATADALRGGLSLSEGLLCVGQKADGFLHVATWKGHDEPPRFLTINLEKPSSEQERSARTALVALGLLERSDLAAGEPDAVSPGDIVSLPIAAGMEVLGRLAVPADAIGAVEYAEIVAFLESCSGILRYHKANTVLREDTEEFVTALRGRPAPAAAVPVPESPDASVASPDAQSLADHLAQALHAPVTAISGHAQLLLNKVADPELAQSLNVILRQSRQISTLIGDLANHARPEELRREPTLVNFLLRNILRELRDRLAAKAIRVDEDLAEGLPRVMLDRRQMEQAFRNILLNAEHVLIGGGNVALRTSGHIDDDGVTVQIIERGPGIADVRADALFEPFHVIKKGGEGAGMALPLARAIVERHGARLTVEERPGEIAFTVSFPGTGVDKAAPATGGQTGISRGTRAERQGPKTVLVVDDDSNVREVLRQVLQMRGHNVQEAEDGLRALEILAGDGIDLVLLDIWMPQRNGLSVLSELRDKLPMLPVIVMTGTTSEAEIDEALRLGARSCLRKPFQVKRLLEEVEGAGIASLS